MDKQQRDKALETLALENNWLFSPKADISNVSILTEFEFQTGEKRKPERIENLIIAGNMKIFDVYWKVEFNPLNAIAMFGHQDNSARNVKYQTMFAVELSELKLPSFHIYPTKSVNLIEQWISKTFHQINFPDFAEFEKRFAVRSHDTHISIYYDKKLIEVYENSEDFWTFGKDNLLFIYQANILISPNDLIIWQDVLLKISNILRGKYL